jgi:hypothetical protein
MLEGACGKGVWEPSRLAGHEFGHIPSDPKDVVPLIHDWINACDPCHRFCGRENQGALPTRLIELSGHKDERLRLVKGASCDGRYMTLSYRWGEISHSSYITTATNYESRQEGFSIDSMPQTIKDAIKIARWLSVKYIWIDAMYIRCILSSPGALLNSTAALYKTRKKTGNRKAPR